VSDENRWKGKELTDPGWRMLLPIGIFTAVNVLLGIFPGPVMDFLGKIAAGAI
jgi:multicomponent Na+:H+ antiporter subunit D